MPRDWHCSIHAGPTEKPLSVAYHEGRFPPAALDLGALFPLVGPANAAIARYEGVLAGIPNPDILLSPLTAREAVLSSKMERRAAERDKDALLARSEELRRQNDMLLQEMKHRVANSLQIIASILLLKARSVNSDETSFHLRDAHQRVMSVAAVQRYLDMTDGVDQIEVGNYLMKLCAGLGSSMISADQPVEIKVSSDDCMIPSSDAVSIGLVVTELVINAIKYAFPNADSHNQITVCYHIVDGLWTLAVIDNGVGRQAAGMPKAGGGLGTNIVAALASSLNAVVVMGDASPGFSVTIRHQPPLPKSPADRT